MPDVELSFILDAQERVTAQLQKVEQSLDKLNSGADKTNKETGKLSSVTSGLTSAYDGLGKMLAMVGVTFAATTFFKDSTEAATEDSKALIILQSRLQSIGTSWGESKGKITEYSDKMVKLGIAESETNDGLGKLITKTGDINSAMNLSTMAADLAASGYGTYTENIDNLSKILSGRGSFALRDYGIKMDESATAAEMLSAVQDKVSKSAQSMSEEAIGNINGMGKRWGEFQGQAGKIGLFFENELADCFNYFYDNNKENIQTAIEMTAYELEYTKTATGKLWDYFLVGAGTIGQKLSEIIHKATFKWNDAEYSQSLLDSDKKWEDSIQSLVDKMKGEALPTFDEFKQKFNGLFESDSSGKPQKLTAAEIAAAAAKAAMGEAAKAAEDAAKKAAEAWQKASDKMKSDFSSFSNKVLSEVDKQKDAIAKLRETMMSGQDKYNAEVERISKKEEEDTTSARKEYKNLENLTAKETVEYNTKLYDIEREKEVAMASAQNELDMYISTYKSQEQEAQKQLLMMAVKASDPNLTKQLAKESGTFLYGIGQSSLQQQFTFNFNGDVNDIDRLKQLIIDALNRQSELAKVK